MDVLAFLPSIQILGSNDESGPTKRTVLCNIARVFDPLDQPLPVSIGARIFMQEVRKLQMNWDNPLPQEFIYERILLLDS